MSTEVETSRFPLPYVERSEVKSRHLTQKKPKIIRKKQKKGKTFNKTKNDKFN